MKQTTASLSHQPAVSTPSPNSKDTNVSSTGSDRSQSSLFIMMALDMSWRLALAVLVPVIAGAELSKHLSGGSLYLFIGLGVALIGSIFVMRQALQTANRLPVPTLTAAQKRAVKKAYDEDDD